MIFNVTNLFILAIVIFICYNMWLPYIMGRAEEGTVEGYVHPTEGTDKELIWCLKISYRRGGKGKKELCYSRRTYDVHEEAVKAYPKGSKIPVKVYTNKNDEERPLAIITSDKEDIKYILFYCFAAVVGGVALAAGYQMFLNSSGQ